MPMPQHTPTARGLRPATREARPYLLRRPRPKQTCLPTTKCVIIQGLNNENACGQAQHQTHTRKQHTNPRLGDTSPRTISSSTRRTPQEIRAKAQQARVKRQSNPTALPPKYPHLYAPPPPNASASVRRGQHSTTQQHEPRWCKFAVYAATCI